MKRKGLAIGIIFTIIGISIIPTIAKEIEITSIPLSKGNWLYVGGNGPNNYTTIQDAVDNACDGDTVFVYDDSSPYYENLIINTSIQLIGSNRENTIIDGYNISDTIKVNHENVTISNFTIKNCGEISYLIRIINCNNVAIYKNFLTAENILASAICVVQIGIPSTNKGIVIKDNIIENVHVAIGVFNGYTHIEDNLIKNTTIGIRAYDSYNIITNNTIENSSFGIDLFHSIKNMIKYNTFFNCLTGISLSGYYHIIQWNEFNGCRYCGISNYEGRKNEIHFNNFINNNKSAYFHCNFPKLLYRNNWNSNYWDDHHTILPRSIPGIIQYRDPHAFSHWYISWIQFDWHPAKEQYDIPGMT